MRRLLPLCPVLSAAAVVGISLVASAGSGYHPMVPTRTADRPIPTIDVSPEGLRARRAGPTADDGATGSEAWVQRGSVVLPAAVASGVLQVDPDVAFAVEDIPGNKYPRKHTLYLNFVGADLTGGSDNSAENKSTLAKVGPYPAYTGGNPKALSIAQAVAEDLEPYGVRVVYLPEDRPSKTVPYTMEMVGGNWQDTNIDSAAGGVAPGADCGALGQRHVVYTFAAGGLGVNTAANTASQEAGHAWGLDHTFNCSSVMSYCGIANGNFSSTCDDLCEAQCQGANSAGCRLTHEMFCGEGADQQNEHETLLWLFGGNEPDVEPPLVNIVTPTEGSQFDVGAVVELRAEVDDNYGGFGWKYILTHDGETVFEEVAYDRTVDDDYLAATNLSNLEQGVWTITVQAEDHYDHVTSQTVTFQVGDAAPMTADDTAGPGSDGGSSGEADTGSADESDGSGGSGGQDVDDGGCACRSAGDPGDGRWGSWLVMIGLGAGLRRRR